jgi:glucosamine--fructose-6-phosphate aminotransferase (isomerizing)
MLEESHLFREINEQTETIEGLLARGLGSTQKIANAIKQRRVSYAIIAARGTSDNAGRYAKYVLGAMNGLPVALATPSLFSIYKQPPRIQGALVLGISQSGQSPDIVAVLQEANAQGALTAAITNAPNSPLAEQAEFVIDLHAGEERAVAATKTYTAELAAVAMLSAHLAEDTDMQSSLSQTPKAIAATLEINDYISSVAPRYRYMDRCVVIGRGYNYATAFELALKLKELTYTIVEPYSSADFYHGPLALIEPGFPVIVIAPAGELDHELQTFMRALNDRKAEIVAISDQPETLSLARIPLTLPHSVPEWLSPITAIIPGQLLALHLANTRDYDVDHPRAIQKVTETE